MTRLMIAGGGTGGHIFPGVAVAEELRVREPRAEVLFVGTGRPVETEVLSRRGLPHRTITAGGLKGLGWLGRLKSLALLPVGLGQALEAVASFKPSLVLGVGGYVSGPVCLAARIMGVPTVIHEQNSVPGLANRCLGRLVNLVCISFPAARGYFPDGKSVLTGNPIRQEISAARNRPPREPGTAFTILVAGGSQGARGINQAVTASLPLLHAARPELAFIHQTGAADHESVAGAYREHGIPAEVAPFIMDMERAYLAADLVICRAGAMTVAEVAALGRPAIFIPFPQATDNHQELNALSLVEAGGALMFRQADLTPELLADTVAELSRDRVRLDAMSRAAAAASRPEAAAHILNLCLELAGGSKLVAGVNHV